MEFNIVDDNFINCTVNYTNGESYTKDKKLEIVANEGFTFEGSYSWYMTNWFGERDDYLFINEGNKLVVDYSPYRIEENMLEDGTIYLDDIYIALGSIVQTTEFVNIYKTDPKQLTEISKARYVINDLIEVDFGSFIANLYKLPFKIDDSLVVDETTNIVLGSRKLDVESNLITTDTITINIGNITVDGKYNNSYDYVNTNCSLTIPFFDKIFIDIEYIMNETLSIEYVIDLYTGICTVNIMSTFTDTIIESRSANIIGSIPFVPVKDSSVIGSYSNDHINPVSTAFVEITRNIPYTKDTNIFGGSVVEYGKIGDYSGYLRCDDLILNSTATNQEQDEINSILRNGVFL